MTTSSTRRPRHRPLTASVGAALLAVLLAACSAAQDERADLSADPSGSTSPSPSASASSPSTAPSSGASATEQPATTPPSSTTTAPPASAPATAPAAPVAGPKELPRGGRTLFPAYRLVGYSGRPGIEALGRLGIGDLDARLDELEKRAAPYGKDRAVLPVLELIATMAMENPGSDGKHRTRAPDDMIRAHLEAARRHDAILLLGIQPGRADFPPEVKAYERWLREPDVGVALDPEWAVGAGERPGAVFGSTTGRELDSVSRYLAGVVARHDLPEKVMVVHQLSVRIIRDEGRWRRHDGVVAIKSVDGIGTRAMKLDTNRVLTRNLRHVRPGFKLFYEEDTRHGPLMTPQQVMAIRPRPDYVVYE